MKVIRLASFIQNTIGSLSYSVKHLETTVVMIWHYINKPKLNSDEGLSFKCSLPRLFAQSLERYA